MAADRQKTIEQRPVPNVQGEQAHHRGRSRLGAEPCLRPCRGSDTDAASPAKASKIKAETIADGVDYPWGLQFLPDGRLLVSERPGRLRLVPAE